MINIDHKVEELLNLTDEFIFPSYYSHTDKQMWKIKNVYTDFDKETLVLCPVSDGIERALDLAIIEIKNKMDKFYK